MEITGKVLEVLPLQSGQGQKGEWKKQEVVFDQGGKFPKKVLISFWNDLANTKFTVGQTMNLTVDCESREFNGRWYTDVKCWKVLAAANDSGVSTTSQPQQPYEQRQPKYNSAQEVKNAAIVNGNNLPKEDDGLPF